MAGYSGTPLPRKLGVKPGMRLLFDRAPGQHDPDAGRQGLVDVKVCAIDETWSGLKFVIRKERRASHAARSAGRATP